MTRSSAPRTLIWPGAISAIALAAGALVSGPASPAAAAGEDRPTYLGKSLYTGEFHAHTSVSDGAELPPDAYKHVHDETDADFFAVTEHDVMWDIRNGDDFVENWRDADSAEWRYLHESADKFNAGQKDLVAVPAIENTWYDGTGHINVFDTDWHVTARATEKGSVDGYGNAFGTGDMKYDYFTFLARLKQDPDAIGQFNHPSTKDKGDFFGFKGLDPVADDRMDLIEVKSADAVGEFQKALDAGWHLAPTWNGDEHSATWVSGNPSITGVWAKGHSLDALYAAMRDRSLYSTADTNAVLAFGGNGALMGSILPGDTATLDVELRLTDPDAKDSFTSARLLTNGGAVAHDFGKVSGNDLTLKTTLDVRDGDFYYVRADQADGNFLVSAPIWIGKTTRGANYAPRITVPGDFPTTAQYGDTITLPRATATDDSGTQPAVTYEVFDSAGEMPVSGGAFRIRSYDDAFVVVKATDNLGNTDAELLRVQVFQKAPDPADVFRFGGNASVGEEPGSAGIAVTTDRDVERVYAQVLPEGSDDWSTAEVLTSANDRPYEVDTVGNGEPVYQHSITGQTLRSHEFRLTGLKVGTTYRFRFGVARDGRAPAATDGPAWTGVRGRFLAGGAKGEPVYILGDVQVPDGDADELTLPGRVLDQLKSRTPGGGTVIQVGDLVDRGGRGEKWAEIHGSFLSKLDLQYAGLVGNHETYEDLDYDAVGGQPSAIFTNMFALPGNGVIGESNYSFDRGDIHFSVLNSNARLDEQLDWLVDDVRASDATWNVVVGHFSYYGGQHADDGGMDIDRDKVTRVLDRLGVDLYVGGHDHVYKRSTIYDGRLATTPEEEVAGTTFVTMGSSGPKFYDNQKFWWDDKVFDENVQMGGVLKVTDAGLRLSTYTIDGRLVDEVTVAKPHGSWKVSSAEIEDRELKGVGLLSSPGSLDRLTVMAATYDNAQQRMIDVRTVDVTLDHRGREQYVRFDTPLPVAPSSTVKLFTWDSLASGKPLQPAVTLREGLAGEGTEQFPYLIDSPDDLAKVDNDPAGHYRLTADLNLTGLARAQIGRTTTFTGVFDGDGHTVSGLAALADQGPGLFADNHGTIEDLVVQGDVTTDRSTAGLVADANHGTIQRVRVDGSLTANSYVGGITGHHFGTVRDSVSTVDVHATTQYAGGVVGVSVGGSVTENVLAAGGVVANSASAGGVAAYGYTDTQVRHTVALNANISASSYAHAIVGRVYTGQTATLEDNHVSRSVPISGQSLTDPPAADNQKGNVVAPSEIQKQAFYEDRGWDFAAVWHRWPVRPDLRARPRPRGPRRHRGHHHHRSRRHPGQQQHRHHRARVGLRIRDRGLARGWSRRRLAGRRARRLLHGERARAHHRGGRRDRRGPGRLHHGAGLLHGRRHRGQPQRRRCGGLRLHRHHHPRLDRAQPDGHRAVLGAPLPGPGAGEQRRHAERQLGGRDGRGEIPDRDRDRPGHAQRRHRDPGRGRRTGLLGRQARLRLRVGVAVGRRPWATGSARRGGTRHRGDRVTRTRGSGDRGRGRGRHRGRGAARRVHHRGPVGGRSHRNRRHPPRDGRERRRHRHRDGVRRDRRGGQAVVVPPAEGRRLDVGSGRGRHRLPRRGTPRRAGQRDADRAREPAGRDDPRAEHLRRHGTPRRLAPPAGAGNPGDAGAPRHRHRHGQGEGGRPRPGDDHPGLRGCGQVPGTGRRLPRRPPSRHQEGHAAARHDQGPEAQPP
ncbi:UNVERIFIED_ORG: hypothetical protein FHR35_008293 [Microbispora rosea subsp. rosea]